MTDVTVPLFLGPLSLEERAKAMEHPTFSCMSTAMQVGDDLMFNFCLHAPEEPKVLDWLTFLYLTKTKMHALYEEVLYKALTSYMELADTNTGIEAARMDMEEYVRARVESYQEDDGLGLRNVSNNGKEA
jgi:hypothetical protein